MVNEQHHLHKLHFRSMAMFDQRGCFTNFSEKVSLKRWYPTRESAPQPQRKNAAHWLHPGDVAPGDGVPCDPQDRTSPSIVEAFPPNVGGAKQWNIEVDFSLQLYILFHSYLYPTLIPQLPYRIWGRHAPSKPDATWLSRWIQMAHMCHAGPSPSAVGLESAVCHGSSVDCKSCRHLHRYQLLVTKNKQLVAPGIYILVTRSY